MELVENAVVGKYRLNRMIGRGGMGSVWHATQIDLDRPCAIKFIEGEYASLPEAQERFKREALSAAKIKSPNIVEIYEHGIWDGMPFIAMELLEGEDLGHRIQRLGRVSTAETNAILAQTCRALQRAHAAGIVHRDLKPDNIFLVRDDDREIAKVVDFGIAKLGGNVLEGSKTRTGAMLGTPYYMSPEQAQGTKAVDARSDLWSLAIITFQCVTGKLPFDSEALGDLLVKIIVSPIPTPSSYAPDLPASFDRWFLKAASRDPRERFQTAKEFSDSLAAALGTSAITDIMDPNAMQAAMAANVRGGTVAMGNTPMPVGGASQPGYGSQAGYGSQPGYGQSSPGLSPLTHSGVTAVGDLDEVPKRKSPMPLILAAAAVVAVLGIGGTVLALRGGKSEAKNDALKADKTAVAAQAPVAPKLDPPKTTDPKAGEPKPEDPKLAVSAKVAEKSPPEALSAHAPLPNTHAPATNTNRVTGSTRSTKRGGTAGKVDDLGF